MRQELCGDIFPDYVTPILGDDDCALLSASPSTPTNSGANNKEFGDPDDYTAGRRGPITWGELWKIESWEVTPGILRNWGWALEGCNDLIQASNRWRAQRNKEFLLPM
jgi:hypothetical protein